jgi:hypothetical protein
MTSKAVMQASAPAVSERTPSMAKPVEAPKRETVPARVTANVSVPPRPAPIPPRVRDRERGGEAFNPAEEDQYDIPAFLRLRGGQSGVPE